MAVLITLTVLSTLFARITSYNVCYTKLLRFNTKVGFPASLKTAVITVGGGPEGVAISPDGRKAYVANKVDSTVSVINTATDQVITTANLDPDPFAIVPVQAIVVSPDNRRVYVSAGPQGVYVLDAVAIPLKVRNNFV